MLKTFIILENLIFNQFNKNNFNMKISIIFLTLLFTVSCNIDSSSDAAFIQLTKDARAEAVLATVAIQMQQNNGFEKVQSLLSELLNTARENLHANNVLNRRAEARCQIYNHKLSERSEYLSSVVESLNAERQTVAEANNSAAASIAVRNSLAKVYQELTVAESGRFQKEGLFYSGLSNTITRALNSVNELSAKLKADNRPTLKFVQTSVKEITGSYSKVFNVNIDLPESFIEMSLDNNAARQRILTWLEDVRGTFASMVASISTDAKNRSDNNNKFNALLAVVVKSLGAEVNNLNSLRVKYNELIASYAENVASFEKFRVTNANNLSENSSFCAAEKAAYAKVKANSESNVKIYEELMNYFLENYRKNMQPRKF